MRMNYNSDSDDELISLKETFGQCEGRATLLHPRESNLIHVRTWCVNCADSNHVTGLWNTVLDASWYRVDSRLVTIDGLGMLLMFHQVSAFSSLVGR